MDDPGNITRICDHLKNVIMTSLDNFQVTILTGQENIHLISPIIVDHRPSSAPNAGYFKLCLTVFGRHTKLDKSETQNSINNTALFRSNCLEQDNILKKKILSLAESSDKPMKFTIKPNNPEVLLANKVLNRTCMTQADLVQNVFVIIFFLDK